MKNLADQLAIDRGAFNKAFGDTYEKTKREKEQGKK
jgi:hypothetical protein